MYVESDVGGIGQGSGVGLSEKLNHPQTRDACDRAVSLQAVDAYGERVHEARSAEM